MQAIANLSRSARLGVEVAALAPTSGDAQTAFLTQPDIAERSRRPTSRDACVRRGGGPGPEVMASIGGHYGWLAVGPSRRAHSKALAMSLWTPIVPHLEVRAERHRPGAGWSRRRRNRTELWRGQYSGADQRGSVQLNVRPSEHVEVGAGAGLDNPNDDDLDTATARLRNLAFEGRAVWRLAPMVVGGEVRRLRTGTVRSVTSARHRSTLRWASSLSEEVRSLPWPLQETGKTRSPCAGR